MQGSASISAGLTPLTDASDPCFFGQKAARLSRIRRAGLPVPEGWVIDSETFLEHLCNSDINIKTKIDDLIAATRTEADSTEETSRQISQLVHSVSFSASFKEVLSDTFSILKNAGPLVVRSSAIGEDGQSAAFAGLLDSILNVNTVEELHAAVLKCWASCWSQRSLSYQLIRKCKLNRMGTLVQRQVQARSAGVLFTRNPVDPASREMVIEYSEGTAESLVSGSVVPERLFVDRESLATKSDSVSEASILLSRGAVQQLVGFGHELERLFDAPQDIEWCLDTDERLWIVQSRPITTLQQPAPSASMVTWSNANVIENFPDPICPLLYSIASEGYYHYFRNQGIAFGIARSRIDAMESSFRTVIGTHGGRMYYNLSSIHGILRGAPFGEFLATAFNQFVGAESTKRDDRFPQWQSVKRGRITESLEVLKIGWKAWRRFRQLERGIGRIETRINDFAHECRDERLTELIQKQNTSSLLELWRKFLSIRQQWTDASIADASSMISYHLTHRLLEGQFQDKEDQAIANRLLTGLCTLVSGLPTDQLWAISRQIRKSPVLAERFATDDPAQVWELLSERRAYAGIRRSIEEFIDEWGFRCSGELLLIKPTYQDEPAALMPILATFVARDGEPPWQHLERQKQKREQETERILNELASRPLSRRIPLIRRKRIAQRLIAWIQRSIACRERARLKQALLYTRLRAVALAIGEVMVNRKLFKQTTDVFFLTWEETESLLTGQTMMPHVLSETAELRRTEWEACHSLSPPGLIQLPEGHYWSDSPAPLPVEPATDSLIGTGVSGGTITGRAVVLSDPDQMKKLAENDILVTQQTDPGWGPILFLVKGLVMERGGMLSHGAILAREYGIPTVVAIPEVTRKLTTGMQIRVDGDRGVVEILEE